MSRFFFHVHTPDGSFPDPEGTELDHLSLAREHAIRIARGIMSGDILEGRLNLASTVEIRDTSNRLFMSLPFGDALRLEGQAVTATARAPRLSRQSGHLRLVMSN